MSALRVTTQLANGPEKHSQALPIKVHKHAYQRNNDTHNKNTHTNAKKAVTQEAQEVQESTTKQNTERKTDHLHTHKNTHLVHDAALLPNRVVVLLQRTNTAHDYSDR